MIRRIKIFLKGLKIEWKQTILLLEILLKKDKSKYQKMFLREQFFDILKGVGLLLILILPGSGLILMILIKLFGKKVLPTGFQ